MRQHAAADRERHRDDVFGCMAHVRRLAHPVRNAVPLAPALALRV